MANQGMPLNRLIDVQQEVISATAQQPQNPNQIVYFTTQQPLEASALPFKSYVSLEDVKKDYGSSTQTAVLAGINKPSVYSLVATLLSQTPNILNGNGSLTIVPLLYSVFPDSTPAFFVTQDITANVTTFATLSDGILTVQVDGVEYTAQNLNFKGVTSLSQIASIIQNGFPSGTMLVRENTAGTGISFMSLWSDAQSTITLVEQSGTPANDLYGANYLDGTNGVVAIGFDSEGETIQDAVTRVRDYQDCPNFYTILTDKFLDDDSFLATSASVQASLSGDYPSIFAYGFSSLSVTNSDIASLSKVAKQAVDLEYTQTHMTLNLGNTYASYDLLDPFSFVFAEIGSCFVVNFNITNSDRNCFPTNKTGLSGVLGDVYSNSQLTSIKESGLDIYGIFGGIASIFASGANQWLDTTYNLLYLRLQAQLSFDVILRQSGSVLIANADGIAGLENVGRSFFLQAFDCGMVTNGVEWRGALPSGLPQELGDQFKASILNLGYFVYNPGIDSRTPTQIANREAPTTFLYAMIAGSIQQLFIYQVVQSN